MGRKDGAAVPAGKAECAACGLELPMVAGTPDDPVTQCPRCGSLRRNGWAFAGLATGTGKAFGPESVAKEPDPDYHGGRLSKPARERRVGMSLTADDGVERSRRREYDRKGDGYVEEILNPDGSVYLRKDHALSAHRNRGSARPKPSA